MAYINSYYHFVFRTKANLRVLDTDTTPRLYKYICGISENSGCRVIRGGIVSGDVSVRIYAGG